MCVLANFLEAQRDAIVERFIGRVQVSATPAGDAIVAGLPALLSGLVRALRAGGQPGEPASATGSEQHGASPLQPDFDLGAVVRAYDLLRDCVFDQLAAADVMPSLGELGVLSERLSSAAADSVQQDIAARHKGSDEERLHLLGLFEQAPGFVCFLRGADLVFELANSAYFQLVGHRDILGKTVREALPEIAGQGYFELLERVFHSGEMFTGRGMKALLQREPGAPLTEAFIDLLYKPIRGPDGRVSGILVQGQDITEAKHQEAHRETAEEALRASEERYRTLFESIDDGYCLMQMIVDADGETVDYRFVQTNAAFEGHTGLRDAVGRTALELVPGLDPSWFRLYGRVAATGESTRFENHDPAMGRWFDVHASRVGTVEQRLVALVFKDVSEQKRVDEERARLFQLEIAARREAEEASRLRDEFLATVSHELRTPLTAILGWVQMLRVGSLPPERHARALETVERNARAQAQLIEDLLDVSSILAGKLRLEVAVVDVRPVVEAALETVRPAADAKGVRLQATLATDCSVMGDSHRLQQVVWNLLSNAVKFTPRAGRVQVIIECRDSSVEITVADTGRGIALDFQRHVFERFRQADGATTRAYGGLGLGLSIVHQLVEMHGGTVSVFSEGEGRGSTFTVRLPLAVARRRDVSSPPALQGLLAAHGIACPPALDGVHVLVVDDEADTREMLQALLEHCGAGVRLASSVAEGMAMFAELRPDVLLSDIGMPGEDGYVLIDRIRKLPPGAGGGVPAVALTAYARTADRTRALLAGFNNHVSKPVEPVELLAVLASLSARAFKREG